jgi:ArsR family transcriptional regulator
LYESEARMFKALGDETRLQILGLLRLRELCVCELTALLPVSQPAVSQHLRRLKEAGLVREQRRSYWTYYALREDLPGHVAALIRQLPESEAAGLLPASSAGVCDVS